MFNILKFNGWFVLLFVVTKSPVFAGSTPLSQWMSRCNDSVSIARLTIPGTHESAALYEPVPGTARCQSLGIREQLEAGVRYLDIRVRQSSNSFLIHHGMVFQNATFDDVLRQCTGFLKSNASEVILMEVSPTSTPVASNESNERTFMRYVTNSAYQSFWWRQTHVPKLGEVRGKIVLIRRFAGTVSGGVDATKWRDNAQFSMEDARHQPIVVQDVYRVDSNDDKWTAITNMFDSAATNGAWHINFTSGYQSFLGIPDITGVSQDINARLLKYFANPSRKPGVCGTIVSDFIDTNLTLAEIWGSIPLTGW